MSIELHTVDNGNVQAINDGRLYSQLTGAVGGIVAGGNCSSSGGLVVSVTSGWGIASGRVFTITAENYTVTPSPSGTRKGRLYVKIDLTDASEPIKVLSITGTSLPALVQQDLSNGGTVYEIELAHYDITTLAVSNLVSNTKVAFAGHAGTADNANKLGGVAASEYMPKSGGVFSGNISAPNVTTVSKGQGTPNSDYASAAPKWIKVGKVVTLTAEVALTLTATIDPSQVCTVATGYPIPDTNANYQIAGMAFNRDDQNKPIRRLFISPAGELRTAYDDYATGIYLIYMTYISKD